MIGRALFSIPTIRASIFGPLMSRLDQEGNLVDALLADHDLQHLQLSDPYTEVPLKRFVAVLEQAAVMLGDQWLGLHVGQHVRATDLGPLGLFCAAAPTVKSAFERMSRFLPALQSHTVARLHEEEGLTMWTYHIEDPTIWPRVQDSELTLAATCQLVRSFLGRSWSPLEVHFEHEEPEDSSALARHFRAPLLFAQPANRLVFAAADVNRPIQNEDKDLGRILERHIVDLVEARKAQSDILSRVQRLIALYVGQGRVTINRLARDLGISPRTLQRELARHDTSLRLLLRKHRQAVTEARFSTGRCNFDDLAQTLGYADGAAFGRAFKSWTGATPREIRNHSDGARSTRSRRPHSTS